MINIILKILTINSCPSNYLSILMSNPFINLSFWVEMKKIIS